MLKDFWYISNKKNILIVVYSIVNARVDVTNNFMGVKFQKLSSHQNDQIPFYLCLSNHSIIRLNEYLLQDYIDSKQEREREKERKITLRLSTNTRIISLKPIPLESL